jgi:hypothetical protein
VDSFTAFAAIPIIWKSCCTDSRKIEKDAINQQVDPDQSGGRSL